MNDKEPTIGSKLLGLFVAEEGAEPAEGVEGEGVEAEGTESPDYEPAPRDARAGGSPRPATPAPALGGESDPANLTDFDAIYAKICDNGDPSTDAILTAYVEMSKTLGDNVLVTAIASMIKGIRADVSAVRDTVARRSQSLQTVVEQKKNQFANRRNNRARTLNDTHATVKTQIQQLQAQITALNENLRRLDLENQQADAADLGTLEAFNQRAAAEANRLSALGRFLEVNSPAKR